jgi:hypothetical protein
MSNIQTIKTEIDGDPLTRGYAGMTDEAVAIDMNTVYRTRNLSSISGDQIFAATDGTEFSGLTDHKQAIWVAFCGRSEIDPFGGSNVALVQWVFGGGSTTISNLSALRTENVSRGQELGVGTVRPGDVAQARLL